MCPKHRTVCTKYGTVDTMCPKQWYGQVSRSSGLAKTILQGTVKGGRRQGRQRKRWEDNIREWTGLAWSSAGPRGQGRTGKNGENWLRNHLWCPNDTAISIERLERCHRYGTVDKMCPKQGLVDLKRPEHETVGIMHAKYRKGWLVSWCFEPSQPQRITSGLNTNFTLSPSYSFHKSSYHKSCFFFSQPIYIPRAFNTGICIQQGDLFHSPGLHRNRHSPQPTLVKNRDRFWNKCRWVDWKGRNKQGRNPWQ